MLSQFSFSNFRSYKTDTTFDFQAEAIPEFEESLITDEKTTPLLPVSAIYGPNGGGKTNLLRALSCLISTVVKPIYDLDKNRNNLVIQDVIESEPFLFDSESSKNPTEFEVYFRTEGKEYRYYIAIKDSEIVSEYLYWRALGGKRTGTVFTREGSNIELGPAIKKNGINRQVNPKMPYLSFLAINYDLEPIVPVQRWFESCISHSYDDPELDRRIMMIDDSETKKLIIRALNDLGIDISDYRYIKEEKKFYTERIINGEKYSLSFDAESDGTKKLLSTLPMLIVALKEGRLVIIDELDSKLHPKLLRYIISLFKKKELNRNGAQLLFTSHDMTTMRNTVFRRDEIWFAATDMKHESQIYSLYDIRNADDSHINNKSAYDKQYLEGRYGADPYLENMLNVGSFV